MKVPSVAVPNSQLNAKITCADDEFDDEENQGDDVERMDSRKQLGGFALGKVLAVEASLIAGDATPSDAHFPKAY